MSVSVLPSLRVEKERPHLRADEVARPCWLPNGAERVEIYGLDGRLHRTEEPDGSALEFRYTAAGALQSVEHSSGERVAYESDEGGKILRAANARGETVIEFDDHGFPARLLQRVDGLEWTIAYERDGAGRVSACLYPQALDWLRASARETGTGVRSYFSAGAERYFDVSVQADGITIAFADGTSSKQTAGQIEYRDAQGSVVARSAFEVAGNRRLAGISHDRRGDREASSPERGNGPVPWSGPQAESMERAPETEDNWRGEHQTRREAVRSLPRSSNLASRSTHCDCFSFDGEKCGLEKSGDHTFRFDEAGRLAAFVHPSGAREYRYDDQGRLTEVCTGERKTQLRYGDQITPVRVDGEAIEYDALGRRTACGNTCYRYNLYGQLTEVIRAEGPPVRYLYDGFGRLVGRECGAQRVYYIVDFDGHRIAEADAQGRVRRSYLWLGGACVGAVDGVIGAPLVQSFHRSVSTNVAAIGLRSGALELVDWRDPYGADRLDHAQIPAIASLFPDPATRLYHAGSRWFDPRTAQFLTPDGWFGTDCWNHMPPAMRRVFDALPGGTNVVETPEAAYVWCRYDPINFIDPNGHSVCEGFGIFWSIISFFLWQMQVTSIALQMAALNFVIMIIPSLIDLIVSAAKDKPLWGVNIFNAIPPLVASSRLMVPWAFPLNSLYNAPGTVFTMGSVIWMRGSQNRGLGESSKRDMLHCNNAADYAAFRDSVAADIFAVPRPAIKGTGNMNAAGDTITGVALDPGLGAGAVLGDFFLDTDPIGVRIGAAGQAEFPVIDHTVGGNIVLTQPLPAAFHGAAIEFFRLDQPLVKAEKDGQTIARSITFVRGSSIHFQNPFPEDFPENGLKATEYLFKDKRQLTDFNANKEFVLIELPAGTAINSYHPGDFLSIRSGNRYFARTMERKQGSRNIVLDAKLDPPAPPLDPKVEVAVMAAAGGAALNNQTAAGDKVTVGALRTLRKHHGLLITFAGPPAVVERRIVLQTFLRCALNSNLPGALQGKPIKADLLMADATKADGELTAADTVTADKDEAKQFKKDQPVRITNAAKKEFNTTVRQVTPAAKTIQLTENPPAADFPANGRVKVILLKPFKTLQGEAGPAPGGGADQTIDIQSDDLAAPVADEPLLVRAVSGNDPPEFRKVKGNPVVVAKVDSAPTNNNNLTIQTFSPDAAKTNKGEAKKVVLRLTSTGANPFAVNDEIYCADGTEEYIGTVHALNPAAPADLILEDPIFTKDFGAGGSFQVFAVEPSGHSTPDASLDESLILIPSDPDEDPVTRARAVPLHEMRHVWQYAVLGPFFFSQPIPWLVDLGFQFKSDGAVHASHKITKWASLGILDKLFTAVALGFSDGGPSTTVPGTVATIKRIDIDSNVTAEQVKQFEDGDPVEVGIGDNKVFNIVDKVSVEGHFFDLRFELESDFPIGAAVRVSVSPFERMNSKINKFFSLNIAQIWGDHLPTSWGRTLNSFLNRESWFPLVGLYPIALLRAGFDQSRMYFEQDASFQSGDLYTSFGVAYPNEIFVGEYARLIAFIQARGYGDLATGVSKQAKNITRILTVKTPPPPPGKTATDLVPGSVSVGGDEVRFRKELMLPMNEKIENAAGAMFVANAPGEYQVLSWNEFSGAGFILDNMADPAPWLPPFIPFFPASFNDLRKVKVKELGIDKKFVHGDPLFETEAHRFVITGAKNVTYTLAYKTPAPAPAPAVQGTIAGLTFTAPPVAAEEKHTLQISCTYLPGHDIFKARGKAHGQVTLPAANLTNVCQDLEIVIAPIVVNAPASVKVGATKEFDASIAPRIITLISAAIPEAAVQARLTSKGGRPAKLTLFAPNKVNAAQDVKFRLVFGTAPNDKAKEITIRVEP